MSALVDQNANNGKGWADSESDSDNEERVSRKERASAIPADVVPSEVVAEPVVVVAEESSSSEDEDDADGKLNADLLISVQSNTKKNVKPSTQRKNLSKKEQREQQLKELDNLSSILKDFGVTEDTAASEGVVNDVQGPSDEVDNEKLKKKRKKKTATGHSKEVEGSSAPAVAVESPAEPIDVASVLKAKIAAKKGSKKVSSDPQKIAVAEALKASEAAKKSKKKKDLSKFNEFSY